MKKNVHLYVPLWLKESIREVSGKNGIVTSMQDFVKEFIKNNRLLVFTPPTTKSSSKTMDKMFLRLNEEEYMLMVDRFGGPSGLAKALVKHYG